MDYSEYLDYTKYNGMGFLSALAAVGAFLIVLCVLIGIALYVLFSIGLMKLAKNKGIENAWLAWIPIGQLYIMGKVIGTFKIFDWEIPKAEMWLPLGFVIAVVLFLIPLIKAFVPLSLFLASGFAFYKLFAMYRPKNATLYTLLSMLLGFMGPILVFVIRNDQSAAE